MVARSFWRCYARQTATFTVSGTNPTTANTAAIEYPSATANYGTVVAVCFDASSGGNLLLTLLDLRRS